MEKNMIIGICGGSASGKTFISKMISDNFKNNIICLSQDSYYKSYDELTIEQKKMINYDHPDAFDIDLLVSNLRSLKNNCKIECPIYSFIDYCRKKETISVAPHNIILIEGMLVLHYPEIRELLDYGIYIDVDENVRLNRMVNRDVLERGRTASHVLCQYIRDMKPMHDQFVEQQKMYADVIIDGNNHIDEVYRKVINCIYEANSIAKDNNDNDKRLIKKITFGN